MYFLMYMKGRTHNDEAIEKMLNELQLMNKSDFIQRTFMNQIYFLMYMKGRTHNDEAIEKMLNELQLMNKSDLNVT